MEGRSSTAVAQKLRNLGRNQTLDADLLVAMGTNFLIRGSFEAATGMSFCCRPAVQEVEVYGGEHNRGICLSVGPVCGLFDPRLRPSISRPQQQIWTCLCIPEKCLRARAGRCG